MAAPARMPRQQRSYRPVLATVVMPRVDHTVGGESRESRRSG
jgi:hypothetical protein